MEKRETCIFNNSRFVLQSCIYKSAVDSGFQYLAINKGENIISDTTDNNIIMVIKGELDIDCDCYKKRIFSEGNMILIPRKSKLSIRVLNDAEIIIFRFIHFTNSCSEFRMELLKEHCVMIKYDFQAIPIKEALYLLVESVKAYINARMDCVCLHKLKIKELFVCLNSFYTVNELVYLFYPLLMDNNDKFRRFILDNYNNFSNVKKLIELSGMSKTRFYEKFKIEFGITAKQWMLKHIKDRVCIEALNPDFTVKEIMFRSGFDNAGQFNKFCHQQFNLSPTELILSIRDEIKYADLYAVGKKGNKNGIK